jgi:hypothetical protein
MSAIAAGAAADAAVISAVSQHKQAKEARRMRESQDAALERDRQSRLSAVREEGLKRRKKLDSAARKVGNRDRARTLFSLSGDFIGNLGNGDGGPDLVFGV